MAVNCKNTYIGWGEAWGGAGWGDGLILPTSGPLPIADPFDVFCVCGAAAPYLIDYDEVAAAGAWTQDVVYDQLVGTGSGGSTTLYINKSIPSSWTLEAQIVPRTLPANNTSVATRRIAISVIDTNGFCVTLLLSSGGISYGAHYNGPMQLLPGSAGMLQEDKHYVLRMVVESSQAATYIYLTEVSDLAVTGQQLRFVLPAITADNLAVVPAEGIYLEVVGTAQHPSEMGFEALCLATGFIPANRQPVAVAGQDRSVRSCELLLLDGSGSYDPENQPISYAWRMTDAPADSAYVHQYFDGVTHPGSPATGYTSKLYSATFATDTPSVGDVVRIGSEAYTILVVDSDGDGDFVQFGLDYLEDALTSLSFRVLTQSPITNRNTVKATFLPDVPGFYKFDLQVFDGGLYSERDTLVVNAVEGTIPRGCTPDASFLWSYLSDFWGLVEDKERIDTLWSALIQVCSTHIHTLWQTEYSKSLRDIQPHVLRRWLHYDLLLREPYTELTYLNTPWAPIAGNNLNQQDSYAGQVLVLSIPYREELISIALPSGQQTPKQLALYLEEALRDEEDRIRVVVLQDATPTQSRLYLYAPFRITVVAGTTFTGFTVGTDTEPVQQETGGQVVGPKALLATRSLFGVPITQGMGVYVVTASGTHVSTVASITDVAGDTHRYQRVNTVSDLPNEPVMSWGLTSTLRSTQLDMYKGMVVSGDKLIVERVGVVSGSVEHVALNVLGCTEDVPNVVHFLLDVLFEQHLAATTLYRVYLWGVFRRHYMPIESVISDIPSLQVKIKEPASNEVLQRNADYFLEEFRGGKCIRFASGVFSFELFTPVPRLWAEHTYLDNSGDIEAQYGIAVDFLRTDAAALTNVDYLAAVRGLWYAYTQGPTLRALRVGVQILLGLPFAEVDGTITEIRTDFSSKKGRMLVQDARREDVVRSYTFLRDLSLEINPATGAEYAEGDTVRAFAPLVRGVEVIDWKTDPDAFDSLISQGLFHRVQQFHTFMVRVDAAVFTLPALTLVLSFLQRLAPKYVKALFIARQDLEEAEIDLSDDVAVYPIIELNDGVPWRLPYTGRPTPIAMTTEEWITLNTNPLNNTAMADDAASNPSAANKGGSGSQENVAGVDFSPDTALPTYPDEDITAFGADAPYLSPQMAIALIAYETFGAPTLPVEDAVFQAGRPVWSSRPYIFGQSHLRHIVPDGSLLLDAEVASANFTLNGVRLQIRGVPQSGAPTLYISVLVNGVEVFTDGFVHTTELQEVFWTDLGGIYVPPACKVMTPVAVSLNDEIQVLLYYPGGRAEAYFNAVQVTLGAVVAWDGAVPQAAGTYYNVQVGLCAS